MANAMGNAAQNIKFGVLPRVFWVKNAIRSRPRCMAKSKSWGEKKAVADILVIE